VKPVYQTIIDNGRGNCWTACIASILEVSIEDVPNFVADEFDGGVNAHQACRQWLFDRGLFMLDVNLKKEDSLYTVLDWYLMQNAYCIASVPSQRNKGGWHSVVMHLAKIDEESTRLIVAHDPNINNPPYDADVKVRRLQFIVPFIPKINQK
jgi:hypothetical protein